MNWCSNNIYRNNCSNKNAWYNHQRIFVPTIIVGTVVPTMIVETAVSTRVVETAAKDIFVPAIIVWTIVSTEIVGTAVPTIIVLTAYYWKSCDRDTWCCTSTHPWYLVFIRFAWTFFWKSILVTKISDVTQHKMVRILRIMNVKSFFQPSKGSLRHYSRIFGYSAVCKELLYIRMNLQRCRSGCHHSFCSAWPRLKLNTKVTLDHHNPPPPPTTQTFWRVLGLVWWYDDYTHKKKAQGHHPITSYST